MEMQNTQQEPSLEELLFFQESETNDDFSQPNEPEKNTPADTSSDEKDLGIDPTEVELEEETNEENDQEQESADESTETVSTEDDTETEEEEIEEETETETETEATSDNQFNVYYDILSSQGVFNLPEGYEFDGSEEGLKNAFEVTKQQNKLQAVQDIWNTLPEKFRPILDYALQGGTDVDNFLSTYQNQNSLSGIDLENKSHQKAVLEQYYKRTTSYNDDKVRKLVERSEIAGTLKEDATEVLDELQEIDNKDREQKVEEARKAKEAREQAQTDFRRDVTKVIGDSALINTDRKGKVKAFMFNEITRDKSTTTDFNRAISSIVSNPEHYVQLADILLDYDPKKGFSLERFIKQSKTKTVSDLKRKLDGLTSTKKKVSGKSSKPKKDNFNLEFFNKLN